MTASDQQDNKRRAAGELAAAMRGEAAPVADRRLRSGARNSSGCCVVTAKRFGPQGVSPIRGEMPYTRLAF